MGIWEWGIYGLNAWVGHLWLNGWGIMTKRVTIWGDVLQKSAGPQGNILSDHCMKSWVWKTIIQWSYTSRCTSNFHVQRVNIPNFANTLTEYSSFHQGKSGARVWTALLKMHVTRDQRLMRIAWLATPLHLNWPHLVFHDSTWLCPSLTTALATCFYSIIDSTLLYHGLSFNCNYSSTRFSWIFMTLP